MIFIHFGLPKTGTKFLQTQVFPQLDVDFYDRPSYYDLLTLPFDSEKTLISSEVYSHKSFIHNTPEKLEYNFVFLERFKKMFPDAKVIVATRERNYLKSLYSTCVQLGWSITYTSYVNRINDGFVNQQDYVDACKRLFSSCYIYRYEDFCDDNQKIVNDLCDFIGVRRVNVQDLKPKNIRFTPTKLQVLRLLNHTGWSKIPGCKMFFNTYINPLFQRRYHHV